MTWKMQANHDDLERIATLTVPSPGASQGAAERAAVVAGQADEHQGYFDLADTPRPQAPDLIEPSVAVVRDGAEPPTFRFSGAVITLLLSTDTRSEGCGRLPRCARGGRGCRHRCRWLYIP